MMSNGGWAPRVLVVLAIAFAFACVGCGDDDDDKDGGGSDRQARDGGREEGGSEQLCDPDRPQPLLDAFAFERAVVARGRADADFSRMLGDDGAALLARADELRTELVQEAALEQNVELPEPEGTALSCSDGGVAAARQPLSIATLLAFGMSAGQLAAAASSAPISGMTPAA
jgi:hypothetical protein